MNLLPHWTMERPQLRQMLQRQWQWQCILDFEKVAMHLKYCIANCDVVCFHMIECINSDQRPLFGVQNPDHFGNDPSMQLTVSGGWAVSYLTTFNGFFKYCIFQLDVL